MAEGHFTDMQSTNKIPNVLEFCLYLTKLIVTEYEK